MQLSETVAKPAVEQPTIEFPSEDDWCQWPLDEKLTRGRWYRSPDEAWSYSGPTSVFFHFATEGKSGEAQAICLWVRFLGRF